MNFKLQIKPAFPSVRKACHLSSLHETEKDKVRTQKEMQLQEATKYCIEKKCKGYQAVSTGLFPLIEDPHTINRCLED